MTRTQININQLGHTLVRVSYDDDEIEVESNLDEAATLQAIGEAMARLGRAVGAEDQARAEAATAADAVPGALARMVSEMYADLRPPELDVELGEGWRAPE